MSNSHRAARNGRVRLSLWVAVFSSLLIAAVIFFPPSSRARLDVQAAKAGVQKRPRAEYVPGQVLVRYRNETIARLQQGAASAISLDGHPIAMQVERFEGSDIIPGLRLAHVAAEDTMTAIAALKTQADVLYAEPNYIMHADAPNDPRFTAGDLYGLTKIGAPTVWDSGNTGSNSIVVGDIDEGIDVAHPDLQANIFVNSGEIAGNGIDDDGNGFIDDVNGFDFISNTGTIAPGDHATHTAGTIGAVGNNGVGVVGVNWRVKLMSLKFLGGANGGFDSQAIAAYAYAKKMRDLFVSSGGTKGANIRVLNNSYGGGGSSQASLDAINALNQSGILFVAAAGNAPESPEPNNDLVPHYPSSYDAPNVIAVAATDSGDNLATFSHFGAKSVDLGAPGVGILSTTPSNTYSFASGTSMAAPHVSGAAALLLAANPNLTVQQLKALLLFNGDPLGSLNGMTLTGRRLNVANSIAAINSNDTVAPGTVTNLTAVSAGGRDINVGWTASGDDGASGTASLYEVSFVDSDTGAVVLLKNVLPAAPGSLQTLTTKIPIGHSKGAIKIREFDNVGNEGTPATQNVSINFVDGNPYAMAIGKNAPLTTGGTLLAGTTFDDRLVPTNLPFTFPFFGQNYTSATISTNGNIYFTPPAPPTRSNGDADDVPSETVALANFRMISGLWDDLYLATDQRADAGVFVSQPDASRVVYRWQGVPCNSAPSGNCQFASSPSQNVQVNFEIELRNDGTIQLRYGTGNTGLFPVVGISGGEADPYVTLTHTSETVARNLTSARTVTFLPRAVTQPLDFTDFFVTEQYRDFLSREPDTGGLAFWIDVVNGCPPGDAACLTSRRIIVSNEYFTTPEYQQTGSFVYRVYRGAFGNTQPFPLQSNSNPTEGNKQPNYSVFAPDRALVVGGANLAQAQLDYANAFVQRPAFISRYPASLTLDQFVDAVLATIKNDLCAPTQTNCASGSGPDLSAQKAALVALGSRGAVMYRLADDNANNPIDNHAFIDAEYNRAFVYTEYAGYLRRNGDVVGFPFWMNVVNQYPLRDPTGQRTMVCVFLTSSEYQQRFSTLVTHTNADCN
jgi:subtilisin family serine protease